MRRPRAAASCRCVPPGPSVRPERRLPSSEASACSGGWMEREARQVLFDDLQRGWSDTTFSAERLRLEALDEDDAQRQHEPEVIRVEDRAQGLVLADL